MNRKLWAIAIAVILVYGGWWWVQSASKPHALGPGVRAQVRVGGEEPPQAEPNKPVTAVVEPLPVRAAAATTDQPPHVTPPLPPELAAVIQEVTASVPSPQQLRQLTPEQAHLTPEILIHASQEMSKLSELLDEHADWVPHGIEFYKRCSLNDQFPTSVRALCYADLGQRMKQTGRELADFSEDPLVPARVKQLAASLKH